MGKNTEVSGIVMAVHRLTLPKVIAMAVAAAVLTAVIGNMIATGAAQGRNSQYETVQATIVTEPELAYGRGKYGRPVVSATVETTSGQRINTAVPTQAKAGHTVDVYRHIETGELYRSTTERDTPYANHTDTLVLATLLAGVLTALTLIGAIMRADRAVERAERAQRARARQRDYAY